ncbi:Thoeris anti-defense Tad2 family protein [Staphylococcus chromogenes]|uniref:Thoeris anti-defense Tad2 family protein n=1 Tax=Staphylococcus chromogenes TaxID=46126 RepID=UPI00188DF4CF|nr:MW1434 family type I TA system toxin [Staphylococcus chromogenes]
MNIQEATKLATKGLLMMTRNEWKKSHQTQILPTNDSFLQCVVSSKDGENLVRYWQPSADDLMADDWEVINPIRDQELLKQF